MTEFRMQSPELSRMVAKAINRRFMPFDEQSEIVAWFEEYDTYDELPDDLKEWLNERRAK
jgi:hypothetical protein